MALKRQEIEEKKREQEIQEWDDHLQGKGYKNRFVTTLMILVYSEKKLALSYVRTYVPPPHW